MAEFNSNIVRAVAIELKEQFTDMYMMMNAMYAEISRWNVHCTPGALPLPFDVKIQLQQYAALAIPTLQLSTWGAEIMTAAYGDTLTYQPCEAINPTPGLTIETTGLLIPDTGLTIHDGGL